MASASKRPRWRGLPFSSRSASTLGSRTSIRTNSLSRGRAARTGAAGTRTAKPSTLKAPAWRVVRGNVAPTQAFGSSCCSPSRQQVLPCWPNLASPSIRLPRIAGASPGSCLVNKGNLGDLLAAPAIVQKNERIGPSRQPMCRRAVQRQSDQVGAVFPVTGSRRESCPMTNPKIVAWHAIFQISNELGYSNGKNWGVPFPSLIDRSPQTSESKPNQRAVSYDYKASGRKHLHCEGGLPFVDGNSKDLLF